MTGRRARSGLSSVLSAARGEDVVSTERALLLAWWWAHCTRCTRAVGASRVTARPRLLHALCQRLRHGPHIRTHMSDAATMQSWHPDLHRQKGPYASPPYKWVSLGSARPCTPATPLCTAPHGMSIYPLADFSFRQVPFAPLLYMHTHTWG